MARQVSRISDLPEAAPIQGDELLEMVQGGVNVRVRADELGGGGPIEITDVTGLPEALDERVLDEDPRLSDSRAPKGSAGGVLSGQYPNPDFAVPMATAAQLDGKVDKVEGKGLSTHDLTDPLHDKLVGLEGTHWRGTFVSLAALEAGVTDPQAGDYADVDVAGEDVRRYIWDASDSGWVAQSGEVAPITAAQVKQLYESNPDTNAFTDADEAKLEGIAAEATKNQTDAYLLNRSNHTGTQSISTIENLDLALYDSTSMAIVILAGGKLELIRDAFGNDHLFGVIPIQTYEQQGIPNCPFTGIIDAFRKADGTFWSEKRIAIHKSVNIGGKTVSQAGKAPYVNLNFDEFKAKAAELGAGFRLLDIYDNALINWIILGIVSRGGQAPRGNTEWGRAHDAIYEMGNRADGQVSNTRSGSGATLTGSGPDSWNHDGTSTGFADWVGNVWEWVDGLKMSDGEFVVAEYSGQPESEWLRTGRYINAGHLFSMTAPPSPVAANARWGDFGKTIDYVGHELLQRLMIEPIDCTKVLNGNFWYNTDGERSPIARASWSNGGIDGPVALNLVNLRSNRNSNVGGRLAFGS